MANFKTSLSGPNTNFTALTPRKGLDTSGERDAALASVAVVGAKVAGKEYAKSQGAKNAGADMSLEEVNNEARVIEDQINASLKQEEDRVAGPLQDTRIAEIKDAQLNEFATNDRTLLALRDRGVISTTEARARRTLNLQRSLSNPINNLFREDFLNAAGDLTGGGKGAAAAMFAETPEELQAREIAEANRKAIAEEEAEITSAMHESGKDRETIINERAMAAEDEQRLARLNRLKTERELTGMETEEFMASGRSALARGIAYEISRGSQANGGKGLGPEQLSSVNQLIEQQYQSMLEQLNATKNISGATRDAEQARLQKWKEGQHALAKAYDTNEMDKKFIENLELKAKKLGWAHAGELMTLNAINPKYLEIYFQSGGQAGFGKALDVAMGEGRGTQFMDAAKNISDFANMYNGGKVENKGAAIQTFDSDQGMEFIAEETANPTGKLSEQLRRAYADAPAESLRTFNGISGRRMAQSSPEIRYQVSDAMDIARQKMSFMLSTKGGDGLVFAEASKPRMTPHGMRSNRVYLDMPEGMEDHEAELVEIYRTVEKHDWMWKHVSDAYMDAADAFNGYLRGEWDVDINPEQAGPAKAGRVAAEVPAERQELTPEQAEEFRLQRPRPTDVAELQEALAAEEAGVGEGVPTEEEEARMTQLLEQRVDIRDRERTRGKPVDPRAELPAQPKVELAPMETQTFEAIAPNLFKFEGGFQNNPDDKGNYYKGELIGTNMGISAAQYKNIFGEEPTVEKMKALTKEQVEAAYKEKYWDKNQIDKMPEDIREMAFNMFVMTSPKNVVKAIQRASGAKEDGILGPQTLKAMRGLTREELWDEYHKYLKSLKSYAKFGKGWKNRYEQILAS